MTARTLRKTTSKMCSDMTEMKAKETIITQVSTERLPRISRRNIRFTRRTSSEKKAQRIECSITTFQRILKKRPENTSRIIQKKIQKLIKDTIII